MPSSLQFYFSFFALMIYLIIILALSKPAAMYKIRPKLSIHGYPKEVQTYVMFLLFVFLRSEYF